MVLHHLSIYVIIRKGNKNKRMAIDETDATYTPRGWCVRRGGLYVHPLAQQGEIHQREVGATGVAVFSCTGHLGVRHYIK